MIHISKHVIIVFDKIFYNTVVLQYAKNIFIDFSQKDCIFTRNHFETQFLIFTVFLTWLFKLILGPKLRKKFMSLLLEHLHLFQRWQKRISRNLKSIPKKSPHTGKKTNQETIKKPPTFDLS